MSFARITLTALAAAVLCLGCQSTRDLTFESPYSQFIGKKVVLVQDCYLYSFKTREARLRVGKGARQFMPEEVNEAFVGKRFKYVEIFGLVRQGSVLTIVSCLEERDPEHVFRRFQGIGDDSPVEGQVVDLSDLTDMTDNPPTFREDMARPV